MLNHWSAFLSLQACVFPVFTEGRRQLTFIDRKTNWCFFIHSLTPTGAFLMISLISFFLLYFCYYNPQMRLPSKPYSTLPVYSLGPSAMVKEGTDASPAPLEPEKQPFGSGHSRHSLRRRLLHNYHDVCYCYLLCVCARAEVFIHNRLCSGCPGTVAAKTGGHRTSRTFPRSWLRTGSPWRSV